MEDLVSIGISISTIDEIIENNGELVIEDLAFKKDKVKEIMDLFKNLNIKNINDYLIYKTDIFYKNPKDIKDSFDKYDPDVLEKILNEDIDNIDEILN